MRTSTQNQGATPLHLLGLRPPPLTHLPIRPLLLRPIFLGRKRKIYSEQKKSARWRDGTWRKTTALRRRSSWVPYLRSPPCVITCVKDTGSHLKAWSHLFELKDAFPEIRVAKVGSPKLKKLSRFCSGRVPVMLYSSLYRALKDAESLGQAVGVLIPADFRPI